MRHLYLSAARDAALRLRDACHATTVNITLLFCLPSHAPPSTFT